ncbi:MAG TPA: XRE family transcriptional regulator [Chloroflexota bacterium]
MNIGFRVRAARRRERLSLRELAARTGLSISFLSQLERDKVAPSIASLKRVADALDTQVAGLLAEPSAPDAVVYRRGARPTWQLARARYELLAPGEGRAMQPQLTTFEPGGSNGDHPVTHAGEELVFVLAGRAELGLGDDVTALEEGDAAYFEATVPHSLRNAGDGPCTCLVVVTPPSF